MCGSTRRTDRKGRGIDQEILDYCVQTGRIYESRNKGHSNVVFVGFDKDGKARFGCCLLYTSLSEEPEPASLEIAKEFINDFCEAEYGSPADFSDLEKVGIARTVWYKSRMRYAVPIICPCWSFGAGTAAI